MTSRQPVTQSNDGVSEANPVNANAMPKLSVRSSGCCLSESNQSILLSAVVFCVGPRFPEE
ncbi:hypothetical protein RBSH_00890 [Rhodopirellula baltica SH28]|uniref:Uncharacterized protein n=1 Tax=Rhodopirellula baltica SH28 TaxID=993517 RepID=K5ED26_RHOBT|nr:hypothetical protein RBSH_00890 [Rhodopirellula baltica SH28]